MKVRKTQSNEVIKDETGTEVYANSGWYIFDEEGNLVTSKRFKRKFIAVAKMNMMQGVDAEKAYEMAV